MKLTLALPWPAAGLSPNSRLHFRAKAQLTRDARQDARYIALVAVGDAKFGKAAIPLGVTFYPPDNRARDLDNIFSSMKPWLDSIAAVMNVNDKQFQPVTLAWGEVKKYGQVVVTLG